MNDTWNETQTQEPVEPQPVSHHRRADDVLGRIVWGAVLIFAGLIFLTNELGYLPTSRSADPWHWIMLGAGGLFLLEALIRTVSVDLRGPDVGRLILGLVLVGIGASTVFGVAISWNWWPIILIVIGLSMLLRTFTR